MNKIKIGILFSLKALILFYMACILVYLIFGPVDFHAGQIHVRMPDLINPAVILLLSALLYSIISLHRSKEILIGAGLMIFSTLVVLLTLESALRIFYSSSFERAPYTFNKNAKDDISARGPVLDNNAKEGSYKVLVQGDSLTWGWGVSEWKDLFPYRLLAKLRSDDPDIQMHTMAMSGMEINWHARNLRTIPETVNPDMIVYLWYINDLELTKSRPKPYIPPWRRYFDSEKVKPILRLYHLMDYKMAIALEPPESSYVRYMRKTFTPYSDYWSQFRDSFHVWATLASVHAKRAIMALYPTLPPSGYSEDYPFREINQRILALGKPHDYNLHPAFMKHSTGSLLKDKSSRFGLARKAEAGKNQRGYLAISPYSPWSKGKRKARFRLKLDKKIDGDVAVIDVVSHKGRQIHGRVMVSSGMFEKEGVWQNFAVDFELKDELTWDMEFRVEYLGAGSLSYETTSISVDYNVEIIDLLPYLTNIKTYATLFDAHPNAQTHEIISEVLYRTIKNGKNRLALSAEKKSLVNF